MGAVCGCIRVTAISCRLERTNNKRVEEARRARVEWLKRLRRECANEREFQTERSQSLWTQLTSTSCSSSSAPYSLSPAALERIRQKNRLHFQQLIATEPVVDSDYSHWDHFHLNPPHLLLRKLRGSQVPSKLGLPPLYMDFGERLEVGQRVGGGGQADIHEVIYDGEILDWCLLKVFRNDHLLADLQRLWVKDIRSFRGKFEKIVPEYDGSSCSIEYGTLLQDGRFAFILQRCWGDLRRAIDIEIVKKKTHRSPPFPISSIVKLMIHIAHGMAKLHERGILHKDLKAANCLLPYDQKDRRLPNLNACLVADFESCGGVMGTGFWRAPEILLVLKKKEGDINSIQRVWIMEGDVYGYAMTCYEILTGCISFEDCAANDYDGVIGGERPPFPNYVDPKLRKLVRRCWHNEPLMRPSFKRIAQELEFFEALVVVS